MAIRPSARIISATLQTLDLHQGGESELPNPLAIGVTLGGLLLDVVVPRPKPRAGLFEVGEESSSLPAVSRTPRSVREQDGLPIAGGQLLG
jgi:hypothetical protein